MSDSPKLETNEVPPAKAVDPPAICSAWVSISDDRKPTREDADQGGNVEIIRSNGERELVVWGAVGFDPRFHAVAVNCGPKFLWWRPFCPPNAVGEAADGKKSQPIEEAKAVMTKAQEQHIQETGCCPRLECQPREGRATPMEWLGSVGRAHSLHCSRCDSVWLVPPPMDEPNDPDQATAGKKPQSIEGEKA